MKSFIKDKWPLLIGIVALASFAFAAGFERIPKDVLLLGSGNSTDKEIRFDNGSSNPPAIKWNNTSNSLQFATDGQNFSDLGSGSGSTINYVINSNAEASPTTDLTATNMVVAGTSSTGLISGKQSFQVTPSASPNANVSWDLSPIPDRWNGKPFAVRATVDFTSVESGVVYNIGIHDGTNFVDSFEVLSPGSYDVHRFVQYDSASTYTFRVEATIGTPSVSDVFYIDDLYFGPGNQVAGQSIADKVIASYAAGSPLPVIPSGNNATVLNLSTEITDTHNAVTDPSSNFTFTAPRAGKYRFNLKIMTTTNTQINSSCYFFSNGVFHTVYYRDGNIPSFSTIEGSTVLDLSAGDTVQPGCQSNGGITIRASVSSGVSNQFGTRLDIYEISDHSETTYGVTPTIEYAYNTSQTLTNHINSTDFGYGAEGTPILGLTPTTNAAVQLHVKFNTPILETDIIDFQFKANDRKSWQSLKDGHLVISPYTYQASRQYGVSVFPPSSLDDTVTVYFGLGGRLHNGATFGGAGASWSSLVSSGYRWRVRKMSQGHVGVPLASDLNSGFIAQGERSDKAGIKSTPITVLAAPTVSNLTSAVETIIPGCTVNLPEINARYFIEYGFQGDIVASTIVTYGNGSAFLRDSLGGLVGAWGNGIQRFGTARNVSTIVGRAFHTPTTIDEATLQMHGAIATSGGNGVDRRIANCFIIALPVTN